MYSFADYDDCNHALDNGYIHEDDLPDLDSARDFLLRIQECVYQTGDLGKLEDCLEELCALLDTKYKGGRLAIKKQNDTTPWHLGYQRGCVDTNMNTQENHND